MHNSKIIQESQTSRLTNSKFLFKPLILSLLFNIFIIILFLGRKVYKIYNEPKVIKIPNDSLVTYTYNKIKADAAAYQFFKMLPNDTSDIIFLGNSLTAGFFLQEMFHNVHLQNRGIGGNTSKDILKRLDEVVEGKPKKIFLEIGINDLSQGINEDTLLENVKQIVVSIKQKIPNTKLYIQPIFPTALQQKILTPKIEEYNKKLEAFCIKGNSTFINLYPAFYKDGGLDTSLTTDGIHLNGKGYFLWKKQIDKYVK